MRISLLKEVKSGENRVALTPDQARRLIHLGHRVLVQKGAGVGSDFPDPLYRKAGARLVSKLDILISRSDLLLKVKEPTFEELKWMRPGQMIFCYLHLAAFPDLLREILKRKIIALGYETVQMPDGSLPLLEPMSEIAGKMATQVGAHFLRKDQGGRGVLLGGTKDVPPLDVVILGGGTVGESAARMAIGLGGKTVIVESWALRRKKLSKKYHGRCRILPSTKSVISRLVPQADLLIGAVLIPGARAPHLVSEALVKKMKKGSVIVDVAVDQGGCIETSRVTSHANPVFVRHGVLHYGVPNIPAVVPVTGTLALTARSFPYVERLARLGLEKCCKKFPEMRGAINCDRGTIVHPGLFQKTRT